MLCFWHLISSPALDFCFVIPEYSTSTGLCAARYIHLCWVGRGIQLFRIWACKKSCTDDLNLLHFSVHINRVCCSHTSDDLPKGVKVKTKTGLKTCLISTERTVMTATAQANFVDSIKEYQKANQSRCESKHEVYGWKNLKSNTITDRISTIILSKPLYDKMVLHGQCKQNVSYTEKYLLLFRKGPHPPCLSEVSLEPKNRKTNQLN